MRTRGHYAALVTIAFALLLKTFLEVNDVLGGPQGLQVKGMKIFGWSFNDNIEIGKISLSFYVSYFVVSMVLLVGLTLAVDRHCAVMIFSMWQPSSVALPYSSLK